MSTVTVDKVTNTVTVKESVAQPVQVIVGGGNPYFYSSVVDHINNSGLTGTRTLVSGFTLNQLAQWVIQIVNDLQTSGLFIPTRPTPTIVSSSIIYV